MGYLVYFGLPVGLLILGFPIFLILLVTSIVAVLTRRRRSDRGHPDLHVRQPR